MLSDNTSILIGNNIKILREKLNLNQEDLAEYLGVSRGQISYYENGSRTISTTYLNKLANLFCVDEYDFYEENLENRKINLAFAFRADTISVGDLNSIASFKKVVRNYITMKTIIKDEKKESHNS